MSALVWTFVTLVSHWRRHFGNFCALFIGLALATALWSGVQAINGQARASYARAAALFAEGGLRRIDAPHGGLFAQELYIRLRRAGWRASPVLEGSVRIGDKAFTLVGVDPMTATGEIMQGGSAGVEGFLTGAGLTLAAPATLKELGLREGATPRNERGLALPPLKIAEGAPPGFLIVDIGAAQRLLDRPGRLSRLTLAPGGENRAPPLDVIVGEALRVSDADSTPGLSKLTDSFHLNLTAFGGLSFLVGLFIAHAAQGLAFVQRLPTIRTLRACGVTVRTLAAALLIEAALLGLVAGSVGLVGGYFVAAALLPNVAATLESIYGAHVDGVLDFEPRWAALGLCVALAGALAAAAGGVWSTARLAPLETARASARRLSPPLRLAGAALALLAASAAPTFGENLDLAFAAIALVMLAAVLLFPVLLAGAMRLGENFARGAVAEWFWADCRNQTPSLSLALTALLLALATNIGVGAMVESFRATFIEMLDDKLVAEVYLEAASDADARRVVGFLRARPEVTAILPMARASTKLDGQPAEIVGLTPHETFRDHFPLLAATPHAWDRLEKGDAALINEQMARRLRISPGDRIAAATPSGDWPLEVVGVYPDYGNPRGQLRVEIGALSRRFPDLHHVAFSVRLDTKLAAKLVADLREVFGPALARAMDQAAVRDMSLHIFEHTFAVTAALNTLTLIVSGVALFAALTTLGDLRLTELAPLWALGVARRRLSLMELARIVALSAATALCAAPLGVALAYLLVAFVNVRAFGWRVPFHLFPAQWAEMLLLAVLTALIAAAFPAWRLSRASPVALLKAFEDEG
jgi:putative ABC transport system permease protein